MNTGGGVPSQLLSEQAWMSQSVGSSSDPRCIEYSFEQLKDATNQFSDKCKLGEGGFGPVYKGNLFYTAVAIKQLRKVSD